MFFQSTDPPPVTGGEKPESFDFDTVRQNLDTIANQIMNTFGQGRERVFEFRRAIADSLPEVRSLGGDIKNVSAIIQEVAISSRRNVVANTEEVKELFAASKVLGISAKDLTDAFLNVGMGLESIGENLETSVGYIQSIGGNAKQVMQDVEKNMEKMNRFQFQDGVLGLTKMAAQASMLRFDMAQTFELADKVMSPEGAIETAAAFQRLGVAAGNFVDPFALMNASINDPGALQDSLVDVAKQFTYFDEKTKSFRINPQGVLTLRELQQQTGVSAAEMSKLGLAAAEADKRLQAINAAGLSITSEEDKQYLSNIIKMEKGEFVVRLEGQDEAIKLSELQQGQLDELIEQQENRPKTLEDIARAQLSVDDIMKNDVAAIKYAVLGGILTDQNISDLLEGTRTITDIFLDESRKAVPTPKMRESSEEITKDFKNAVEELISGGASTTEILDKLKSEAFLAFGDLSKESILTIRGASEKISERMKEEGGMAGKIGENLDSLINGLVTKLGELNPGTGGPNVEDEFLTNVTVEGMTSANRNLSNVEERVNSRKSLVELLGKIDVDVNFDNLPSGLTNQQLQEFMKTFSDKLNEERFKNYIISVTQGEDDRRGVGSPTY